MTTSGTPWQITWAHLRAVLLTALGLLTAVIVHRPDLLVATTPLVVIAVWSATTKPSGDLDVVDTPGRSSVREGAVVRTRFHVHTPARTAEVTVVSATNPWVEAVSDFGVSTTLVRADEPVTLVEVPTRMTRWGVHPVGPALIGATSSWGAYHWGPITTEQRMVEVIPVAAVFDAAAAMPHPVGVAGLDRSPRPGDGSEFASIRQFQLGDRLRRVHWPSSLRSRDLHVTSAYAEHDSQVIVMVDAVNDIGRSGGVDGATSTLDSTVRSAAALCEHYVHRGDRVGLQVSGSLKPALVRPATGRRHLRRMLSTLAAVRPGGIDARASARMRIEPGAVILMCSPLISERVMERALDLARRRLTLVVIDTLPQRLTHEFGSEDPDAEALSDIAWRIRMLERDVDVRRVTEAGIPVVAWQGPGSLDHVLRTLARRGRAPRLVQR